MNIVKYLTEGERRGFEIKLLKKNLLTAGFKEVDVNKAIIFFEAKGKEQLKKTEAEQEPAAKLPADETAGRRILMQFFHPRNAELETIKKEVEDSESEIKPEIIEIVSYEKEEIEVEKKNYPKREPKSYQYIESTDDLARLKEKIKQMKKAMASEGFKGAGL